MVSILYELLCKSEAQVFKQAESAINFIKVHVNSPGGQRQICAATVVSNMTGFLLQTLKQTVASNQRETSIRETYGHITQQLQKPNITLQSDSLTLSWCRSFCSRWLPKSPPPQWETDSRMRNNTFAGRIRSQRPPRAWGTAERLPNTSRQTPPRRRNEELQRSRSTRSDQKTRSLVSFLNNLAPPKNSTIIKSLTKHFWSKRFQAVLSHCSSI